MLKKIKNILEKHVGKKNSVTSAKIAESIGIKEDATHAKTRALIFECAQENKLPVAATNRGYFLIETQDEYNDYIKNLDDRIRCIEFRKTIVSDNYRRKK